MDNNNDSEKQGKSWFPSLPLLKFYSAYVIFCLGDRLWTFANAFIFQFLGGMRLVSADQFVESFAAMSLSTWVGNWLDRHNRRAGAFYLLAINNLGLALSATLLGICLTIGSNNAGNPWMEALFIVCLVLAILLSSLTKCAAEGERLMFTKDWVVVLAQREVGPDKQVDASLSKQNATMVIIDQLASVLGPLMAGFVLSLFSYQLACAIIVGWNLFSLVAKRLLLANVYGSVAELSQRAQIAPIELKLEDDDGKSQTEESPATFPNKRNKTKGVKGKKNGTDGFPLLAQVRTYYRQAVFPAAFGLALLYATVLGFDGLAVGFGKAQGMHDDTLGIFRSVSSVLGLLGAVAFAPAERCMGLRQTGLVGLSAQHVCLWLCVLSIWLPGSPFDPIGYAREWTLESWLHSSEAPSGAVQPPINGTDFSTDSHQYSSMPSLSILCFFIGLTLSRFGLWMADLAIIQLMQLYIAEAERGTVFGVQNGFQQFFSMLKDVLVILLPDPRTFGLLIIFSIFCVGTGFVQYIHYLLKNPKKPKLDEEKDGRQSTKNESFNINIG